MQTSARSYSPEEKKVFVFEEQARQLSSNAGFASLDPRQLSKKPSGITFNGFPTTEQT
jgi:hypothetical protein